MSVQDSPRCSAKGCRAPATVDLTWRNPRLHDAARRKHWVACDEHADYLADFLARRGFLLSRRPLLRSAARGATSSPVSPSRALGFDRIREEVGLKLGVSRSLLGDDWSHPVHGLRHPPEADTSGWYCWTGDLSQDPHFFVPLHEGHLIERIPELAKYLKLPPGSRFVLTPDYVDTWYDASLLDI